MRIVSPVATSQSRAVLSLLPVARYLPSGEKSTPQTSAVCPLNSRGKVSTVGEEITVGGSGVNVGMGADVVTGVAQLVAYKRSVRRPRSTEWSIIFLQTWLFSLSGVARSRALYLVSNTNDAITGATAFIRSSH